MSTEHPSPRRPRSTRPTGLARVVRVCLFFATAILLVAHVAVARPGGGSSFSGGSRSGSSGFSGGSRSTSSGSFSSSGSRSTSSGSYYSSSGSYSSSSGSYSGGGGGGGGAIVGLVFLVFIVAFIVVVYMIAMRSRPQASWSTFQPAYYAPPPPPRPSQRRVLEGLRQTDPNFSLVLFDDFLYALYAELKTAQGKGQSARYAPYLSPEAQQAFATSPGGEVVNVVVGSMAIEDVSGLEAGSPYVNVTVQFETNYGVRYPNGEGGVYAHEEWVLRRKRDAKSRTPDKARVIGCPSCGAPLENVAAGVCRYCNQSVGGTGDFDWVVVSVRELAKEARGPMLTGNVAEEGTNLPTVSDPAAPQRFAALQQSDPQTTWQGIEGRLHHVFREFQTSWANRDLAGMRPLMSDALFSTQQFWISEYKRQGLRNITENARITRVELAAVTQDAFYDAITVRFWASSLDYTVSDANNQIVSGDRSRERAYSEYWTLIRGRGAKGPPRIEKVCPKCGAPLSLSMGGNCNYCQAKVTSGEFDWVLSRIEQDEVYRG